MGIILKSNLNTNLKFGTYIANMFDNVGVKFQKFWFSSFLVIEQSSRLSVQPSYIGYKFLMKTMCNCFRKYLY